MSTGKLPCEQMGKNIIIRDCTRQQKGESSDLSDYTRCGEKYGLAYIDSEKDSNHGRPLGMSHPKSIYLYI